MKGLLIVLFILAFAGTCLGQAEPPICGDGEINQPSEVCDDGNTLDWDGCKADCSAVESDEDVNMYMELQSLEAQKAQLLHTQQEFNMASVNARRQYSNDSIARWQAKYDEAFAADRFDTATSIQVRIDELIRLRDLYDSTDPGSPRDIASNLGPQISVLSQSIEQLREQLGIPEPE